jgi:hypothetical protein
VDLLDSRQQLLELLQVVLFLEPRAFYLGA